MFPNLVNGTTIYTIALVQDHGLSLVPLFFSHLPSSPSASPLVPITKIRPESDFIAPHYHNPNVSYRHLPSGPLQEPLNWSLCFHSCQTHLSPCSIQNDHFNTSISSFIDPTWNLQWILNTLWIKSKVLTRDCHLWCSVPWVSLQTHVLSSSLSLSGVQSNCSLLCYSNKLYVFHIGHCYSPSLEYPFSLRLTPFHNSDQASSPQKRWHSLVYLGGITLASHLFPKRNIKAKFLVGI